MADQDSSRRIRDYLEQHRHTYDRNALRQQLLVDGHDEEAVDLAMAQVYGFQVTPAPPSLAPAVNGGKVFLIAGATFLANYILLPIVVVLLTTLTGDGGGFGLLLAWVAPLGLAIVGETVAAIALRTRNRTLARGLAWGIGISLLPLVGLAILLGVCIALISGLGSF